MTQLTVICTGDTNATTPLNHQGRHDYIWLINVQHLTNADLMRLPIGHFAILMRTFKHIVLGIQGKCRHNVTNDYRLDQIR